MEILIQIILFLLLTIGTASVIYFVFYYHGGIVSNIDNLMPSFNTFGQSVDDGNDDFNITYTEYNKTAQDVQKSGIANNQCTNVYTSGWWGKQYFTGHQPWSGGQTKQLEANHQEWITPSDPNSVCYTKTTETDCTGNCIWYPDTDLPAPVAAEVSTNKGMCGPPPLQCKKSCPNITANPGGGTPVDGPNTKYEFSRESSKLTIQNSGNEDADINGDEYCGNGSGNGNLGFIEEGGKWVPKCACVNYVY